MTSGAQEATGEPARPAWVLTPLEKVGPLHFGMRADEVTAALPGARELSRFRADPFSPEILGIQFGLQSAAPAVFVRAQTRRRITSSLCQGAGASGIGKCGPGGEV